MTNVVQFTLSALVLTLMTTTVVKADVMSQARTYCQDEFAGSAERIERCVQRQLDAANAVAKMMAPYAENVSAQLIYQRCARRGEDTPGVYNWMRIRNCLNSDVREFKKFERAAEAAKGNEFQEGVIAYCRETLQEDPDKTYSSLNYCRTRQTKAGYEVGEAFKKVEENSPQQFALDDCVTKNVTPRGNYNWEKAYYCTKWELQRLNR